MYQKKYFILGLLFLLSINQANAMKSEDELASFETPKKSIPQEVIHSPIEQTESPQVTMQTFRTPSANINVKSTRVPSEIDDTFLRENEITINGLTFTAMSPDLGNEGGENLFVLKTNTMKLLNECLTPVQITSNFLLAIETLEENNWIICEKDFFTPNEETSHALKCAQGVLARLIDKSNEVPWDGKPLYYFCNKRYNPAREEENLEELRKIATKISSLLAIYEPDLHKTQ